MDCRTYFVSRNIFNLRIFFLFIHSPSPIMIEGVIPTLPLETHHRRTLFAPKNDHSSYDADDREEQQDEDGSSSCYVPIKINVVDDNTPVVSMIVPSHNNNNHSSTSSCHCFEYYRESMPKDIQPTTTTTTATTTTTNAEKVRNKFVEVRKVMKNFQKRKITSIFFVLSGIIPDGARSAN